MTQRFWQNSKIPRSSGFLDPISLKASSHNTTPINVGAAGDDVAKAAIAILCHYNRINPKTLQYIPASASSEAVRTVSMGVVAKL